MHSVKNKLHPHRIITILTVPNPAVRVIAFQPTTLQKPLHPHQFRLHSLQADLQVFLSRGLPPLASEVLKIPLLLQHRPAVQNTTRAQH